MKKGDESKISLCYPRSLRNRSSWLEVFCKKGVLRNFAKLTGKQACSFIKKETLAQLFSCEFCEISKNTFSHRTPPMAASREIPLTPIASVVA